MLSAGFWRRWLLRRRVQRRGILRAVREGRVGSAFLDLLRTVRGPGCARQIGRLLWLFRTPWWRLLVSKLTRAKPPDKCRITPWQIDWGGRTFNNTLLSTEACRVTSATVYFILVESRCANFKAPRHFWSEERLTDNGYEFPTADHSSNFMQHGQEEIIYTRMCRARSSVVDRKDVLDLDVASRVPRNRFKVGEREIQLTRRLPTSP